MAASNSKVKINILTKISPIFSVLDALPTLKSDQILIVVVPIKDDATRSKAQNLTALNGSFAFVLKINVVKAVPPNSQKIAGFKAEDPVFTIPKVYHFDEFTPVSWAEYA
jgi:hypothetical protein